MILSIIFKFFISIFLLNIINNAIVKGNMVVDAPDVAHTDFDKYVKSAKRTPVILQYPALFIFSTGAISDFRAVSKLLADDPKCEFVTVESTAIFDGDITSLEPVLSYVKDGQTKKYDGPINVGYILAWLTNQNVCDMRVKDLSNFKNYQATIPKGHLQAYVLFGENQHDPEFVERVRKFVVDNDLAVPVVYVPDHNLTNQILKTLGLDANTRLPNVLVSRNMRLLSNTVLYNKDPKNDKELRKFLFEEMVPSIHSTDSYMLPKFLTMRKTVVYIFTKEHDLKKYLDENWLKTFPKKHSEKLIFLHSKGSELVENKMNNILAIDSEYEQSVVRAFVINVDTLEFYKFKPLTLEDGNLNERGLEQFAEDLEKEKLSHYVKSELPIPENIDKGPVKTLVGEDFHKRVIESNEDVLVLFLSSWCGHCHQAKRIFRDMGRRLKGTNGPMIATFDAFNNEIEDMEITQFPTIVLYQSGKKDDPLFYTGEVKLEELAVFLEQNCKLNKISAENMIQKHVSKESIFEFHTEL